MKSDLIILATTVDMDLIMVVYCVFEGYCTITTRRNRLRQKKTKVLVDRATIDLYYFTKVSSLSGFF